MYDPGIDFKYLGWDDRYYYIDIETESLKPKIIWCAVVIHIASKEVFRFTDTKELREFMLARQKEGAIWVGHNILSFDIPAINDILAIALDLCRLVDTLVLSYLYWPKLPRPEGLKGTAGPHSLEAWGLRLGHHKIEFNDFSKFVPEMLTYCEGDCTLGVKVFKVLIKQLTARGFSELSCWIEHNARRIIDKQERYGFFFDIPKAQRTYRRLRHYERMAGEKIRQHFKPKLIKVGEYQIKYKKDGSPSHWMVKHEQQYPVVKQRKDGMYECWDYQEFNIGSPQQRLERLLEHGYKPTKKTKKGAPSVDEDSLLEFAESSGVSEVKMMAYWLVLNGRANMIGTWLDNVNYDDSRMHGRVFTCGAASRRMTHSSPNTANIPSNEARFGKVCRSIWTVSDTKTRRLVGYDSKANQMRMFVHYVGGTPKVKAQYIDAEDPHAINAEFFGIPRKPSKNVFYAFLFGAQVAKINTTAGFPRNSPRGKEIRDGLIQNTEGLQDLIETCNKEFSTGFITCIDGGKVRPNAEHQAINYKIQSAEGIVMKLTTILLDDIIEKEGLDAHRVGDIHDEGQLDCAVEVADYVGKMAVACHIKAGELLEFCVPLDGDYKVGLSWKETH